MSEWRLIRTAPKDVPVLGWDPYFLMKVMRFDHIQGFWVSDGPYDFEVGGKEIRLKPTHWMPLPTPPDPKG